jgi:hypothetical protein
MILLLVAAAMIGAEFLLRRLNEQSRGAPFEVMKNGLIVLRTDK